MGRVEARIALVFAAGVACTEFPLEGDEPLVVEEGCQPLLADTTLDEVSRAGCLLPYPSDFYRAGSRIVLPATAKPRLAKAPRAAADIHEVVPMDGYSLVPTIVATLPSPVVRDGLPNVLDDPARSATSASPSVIVDAETGAFVAHYTDKIDRGVDARHEPIVLRPVAPLAPRRRYVVALRGVRLAEDSARPAPPPEGFRRLRDHVPDAGLDGIRARFETGVFGVLARAGVPRSELQLAWDFTTGSEEEPRADMLRVRELTLAWLARNTPAITISAVTSTARTWRHVEGTITGPLFVEHDRPGALLARDADGKVRENGRATFGFTANVPVAVRDAAVPGRALAFGHGFFGTRGELDSNSGETIANTLAAVTFGIDWWGMAKEDIGNVANTLGEAPEHGADFGDRIHQAMANWLVTTSAIKGPLATLPELRRPESEVPVYDPSFVSYFGASLGHVLGGTLVALDPNISRAVLNVGGGALTHIMPRSGNFGPFAVVLEGAFHDELLSQAFVATFQRAVDRFDPITYAPLVVTRPLPGSPDRRVLLQIGLGDPAVPNVASYLHARALGIAQTMPAPEAVFGLPVSTDPGGSAITLFDYGIDRSPWADAHPIPNNEVHEGVRINPAALREMDAFLRPDGKVSHPCDGPCDPG